MGMHVRARGLALVLAAVAAMSAACLVANAGQPVQLVWSAPGGAAEFAVYQRVAEEFMIENPNIRVQVIRDSNQAELILAGNSPDIIFSTIENFPSLHATGIVLNLQPYIDRDNFDWQDFFPEILNPYRFNGEGYGSGDIYGLPKETAVRALFFNVDAFAAAGLARPDELARRGEWTWETFLEAARRLTIDRNGDRIPEVYGFGEDTWFGRWMPWIWSAGGNVVDDPYRPTRSAMTDADTIAGMEFFASLQRDHGVFRRAGGGDFRSGAVAMFANGRWEVPGFREITDFTWEVTPRPTGPAGRAQLLTGSAFMISTQSQHPDEAWELLKYITSQRGQSLMTELGLLLPSRLSVARSDFLASRPPENNDVFLDEIQYAKPGPMLPNWRFVQDSAGPILNGILAGNIPVTNGAIQLGELINRAIAEARRL